MRSVNVVVETGRYNYVANNCILAGISTSCVISRVLSNMIGATRRQARRLLIKVDYANTSATNNRPLNTIFLDHITAYKLLNKF